MVLTKEQFDILKNGDKSTINRGIATKAANKWNIEVPDEPTKVGVPYRIHQVFAGREQTIRSAMNEIEANSCIR